MQLDWLTISTALLPLVGAIIGVYVKFTNRITKMEEKMTTMEEGFDEMSRRVLHVESSLSSAMSKVHEKLDQLSTQQANLLGKVDTFITFIKDFVKNK